MALRVCAAQAETRNGLRLDGPRWAKAELELRSVRRALGQLPAATRIDAEAETGRIGVQCLEGAALHGPVLVRPCILATVPAVDSGAGAGACFV